MAQDASSPADTAARIDTAIARIESAMSVQAARAAALTLRHATLKTRMAEAVQALDDVIAKDPTA